MTTNLTASILFVTKNGERYLDELLTVVKAQAGCVAVTEIIAVDSGSRDRTLDILRRHEARIVQIPAHEFGHGKTRNLAASHATGDFLVFLTQDATPADADWLTNLVAPLIADAHVVGAFSRHLPRPHCHPMEWRRIVQEELSGRMESRINSRQDNPAYAQNPAFYHFFANVSSVVRREVWSRFPFPVVEFGEDQLWARQVLEAGYKTAYCADSLVYHSHGYGPWDNFCRHFDHFWGLSKKMALAPQRRLTDCVSLAIQAARKDLSFWRWHTGHGRARVAAAWGVTAVSWHLAANLGVWLGERSDRLPSTVCQLFSLQERIKRR
jgi:rhamnosyltransferase